MRDTLWHPILKGGFQQCHMAIRMPACPHTQVHELKARLLDSEGRAAAAEAELERLRKERADEALAAVASKNSVHECRSIRRTKDTPNVNTPVLPPPPPPGNSTRPRSLTTSAYIFGVQRCVGAMCCRPSKRDARARAFDLGLSSIRLEFGEHDSISRTGNVSISPHI